MRKHRKQLLLACSAVLLPALGMLGYFHWVVQPQQEAQRVMDEGMAAMAAHELSNAVELLGLAREHGSTALPASLGLFELLHSSQPEQAQALVDELSRRYGDIPEVEAAQRLLLTDTEHAKLPPIRISSISSEHFLVAYAAIRHTLLRGDVNEGWEALQRLHNMYPRRQVLQLLRGQILAASGKTAEAVIAKRDLFSLLQPASPFSFEAALTLLVSPSIVLLPHDIQLLSAALQGHPWFNTWLDTLPGQELRLLVNRCAAEAPASALVFAEKLQQKGVATTADRVAHLDLLLLLEKYDQADLFAQQLAQLDPPHEEEALALVRHAFATGQTARGIAILEQMLERAPESNAALRLSTFYLSGRGGAIADQARMGLLEIIAAHPASNIQSILAAYTSLIEINPESREAYIAAVLTNGLAADHPILVAEWLISIGEASRALEYLPHHTALSQSDAFAARFDALLASGRSEEAKDLLASPWVSLNPLQESLLRTFWHTDAEQPEQAAIHLKNALGAARQAEDPQLLLTIGDTAMQIGAQDTALRAYSLGFVAGANFGVTSAIQFLQLLLLSEQLDTAAEFAAYCHSLNPSNPLFLNNHCYIKVLRRETTTNCIASMQPVVDTYPDFPSFRGTLALALLLNKEPRSALDLWSAKKNNPQEPETSHERMISALLFAANNQTGLAEGVARSIDLNELNRFEIELLQDFGLLQANR